MQKKINDISGLSTHPEFKAGEKFTIEGIHRHPDGHLVIGGVNTKTNRKVKTDKMKVAEFEVEKAPDEQNE